MIAHALGELIRDGAYIALGAAFLAWLLRALALPGWGLLPAALLLDRSPAALLVALAAWLIARRAALRGTRVLFDVPAWLAAAVRRGASGKGAGVVIGLARGVRVAIPAGGSSGSHTLVVGATGSGKTVTQALIAERLIAAGCGAIVVDPKGDGDLHERLRRAASARGASFCEWTPDGNAVYNPYGSGSTDELADKVLAGELFTEPHYLRQAQRYIAHAVRALRAAQRPLTPRSLLEQMVPAALGRTARALPGAEDLHEYLDSLTERQQRELAGVRDRLAILAESDVGRWLEPAAGTPQVALSTTALERGVLYVRTDADRRPLLAQMLGAALVVDLVSLVARHQGKPLYCVAMIDEFAAVAADSVVRLFARARAAGVSVVLGTQEIADLRAGNRRLDAQVLGNIGALVAHRQMSADSAELISRMAGEEAFWQPSLHEGGLARRRRSRSLRLTDRRRVAPDALRALGVGEALVLVPGAAPRIVAVESSGG